MLPRKSKLLWRNLWWLRSQYLGEWFGHSLSKLCSSNDETRQSHARFDSLLWCRLQAVSKWSLWREPHSRLPSMHFECTVAHRRCRNLPGNDIRKPRDFFSSEVSSLSKEAFNGMVGRRAVEWEPTTSWVEAKLYISMKTLGSRRGKIALEANVQRNHPRENRVSSIHWVSKKASRSILCCGLKVSFVQLVLHSIPTEDKRSSGC